MAQDLEKDCCHRDPSGEVITVTLTAVSLNVPQRPDGSLIGAIILLVLLGPIRGDSRLISRYLQSILLTNDSQIDSSFLETHRGCLYRHFQLLCLLLVLSLEHLHETLFVHLEHQVLAPSPRRMTQVRVHSQHADPLHPWKHLN